jgi:ankyrin repeat protein
MHHTRMDEWLGLPNKVRRVEPPPKDFFTACSDGDIAEMEQHLRAGVDPNAPFPPGALPLTVAVHISVAAVELLLRHGADPNKKIEGSGATALDLSWDPEISRVLLRAGADPNTRDDYGVTPLIHAPDGIQSVLLEGGADPNCVSGYGRTPLVDALQSQKWDLAQLLLRHGADPNLPGEAEEHYRDRKKTPLVVAINRGASLDIIGTLLDAGAAKDGDNSYQGQTPFMAACMWARVDVMKLLVARGTNKYNTNSMGWSPVVYAGFASAEAQPALRSMYLADASSFCRGIHPRLGADSPVSLLVGFPGIMAFIVDRSVQVKSRNPHPELP